MAAGNVDTMWVFGYGSLVSPESLGATVGRPVGPHGEGGWAEAELCGWGRRWNYGIGHLRGRWLDVEGNEHVVTIVALGLVAASDETANGIVARVTVDELARLDRRERHYDRVDVTDLVELRSRTGDRIGDGVAAGERIVTYVPRPEAVERYERARDGGTAAIEQRYWDLVDGAFEALGAGRVERYRASTPTPDVPVLPVRRE